MKNFILNNKIKGFVLISAMIVSIAVNAQIKTQDITGTEEVDLKLACELTLIQGDKASLQITGDQDALKDLEIKVSGNRLSIINEENHQHRDDVSISITLPNLKQLSIEGPVDIKTPRILNFEEMLVDVTGVADFDLKLKSKTFRLNSSGVLSGEIEGETETLFIDISGVGKLNATEFKAKDCKIDVSGVGRVAINVTDRLDASVSGMGKIHYTGNPRINAHSSGIGGISKM